MKRLIKAFIALAITIILVILIKKTDILQKILNFLFK